MILSSKDGGTTWETKHQNLDGEVLLDISFANERVGHVAGTGGLLLSTDDGGQTWKNHVAPGAVRAFSFADVLLGRRIMADEAISVRAIGPPALSEHRRQQQFEQLRKYFAEVDSRPKPGSAEEADEILTEAIRSTRPSYRPHQ
jgi:hypothetical protein